MKFDLANQRPNKKDTILFSFDLSIAVTFILKIVPFNQTNKATFLKVLFWL
jgi:hypothetical protein